MSTPTTHRIAMRPERLLAFSDGVLAIIITLMILEIKLPSLPEHPTAADIHVGFTRLLPHFLAYVLSFTVLAIFWINHHSLFLTVREVSVKLLWHNCIVLFFASLVPFTTAFLGEHYDRPEATLLYGGVQLMILTSSMWMVAYLFRKGLVHADLNPAMRRYYTRLNSANIILTLAAMALGFVSTWISIALFVITIALYLVPKPLEVLREEGLA
jgi:uncharacterized membrane protein